jgi:hypothetical protein
MSCAALQRACKRAALYRGPHLQMLSGSHAVSHFSSFSGASSRAWNIISGLRKRRSSGGGIGCAGCGSYSASPGAANCSTYCAMPAYGVFGGRWWGVNCVRYCQFSTLRRG